MIVTKYLLSRKLNENDIEKLYKQNIEQFNILEFYYRVRLIIDYISGMTDDFALEEYQILSAIK